MPINIPSDLPARNALLREQVFVMTNEMAVKQDIRPLRLLFLNLMPLKITTEIQYMRKLSNTPLQVDIELLRIDHHSSKNSPSIHLDTFYHDFADIEDKYYDGMIITGAPLDQTDFADVSYMDKMTKIVRWSQQHVTSTLFSCWAAAVGLKIFYDLELDKRSNKLSGVYRHFLTNNLDPLVRGFDDTFLAPHSRFIDFKSSTLREHTDLNTLAISDEAGVFLASTSDHRQVYVTGHPEYDAITLKEEYIRDIEAGKDPALPKNYFPHDDVTLMPSCIWRSHASMLFGNWLNYCVYQQTPYVLQN